MLKTVFAILSCYFIQLQANDTLRILFAYGSKPKGNGETHWFGGLHGGHVSISYKGEYASFVPDGAVHIFPKRKNKKSAFIIEKEGNFVYDTTDSRYLILSIPINQQQSRKIDSTLRMRLFDAPYDYAFLGMRCASAVYEVLATAGLYPICSYRKMSCKYFYPKLLRKQLLKQASALGWGIYYRPGRKYRKWEKD